MHAEAALAADLITTLKSYVIREAAPAAEAEPAQLTKGLSRLPSSRRQPLAEPDPE